MFMILLSMTKSMEQWLDIYANSVPYTDKHTNKTIRHYFGATFFDQIHPQLKPFVEELIDNEGDRFETFLNIQEVLKLENASVKVAKAKQLFDQNIREVAFAAHIGQGVYMYDILLNRIHSKVPLKSTHAAIINAAITHSGTAQMGHRVEIWKTVKLTSISLCHVTLKAWKSPKRII